MRRLLPAPAAPVSSIRDAYAVARPRPAGGRPWIGVCMVSSLDGSTAVKGRSSTLSNPNDAEVLHSLRDIADVILVGAGTVRDEGYGEPRRPGQRVGVVTNSGDVDTTTPLFTSGAGFVVCPAALADPGVDTLRAGAERVDLAEAVHRLEEVVPGVSFVQAEGGAGLNGSLASLGLIDELNVTFSPQIVGGDGPRLTSGAPEREGVAYELAHLLVDDDSFLFSRWVRR